MGRHPHRSTGSAWDGTSQKREGPQVAWPPEPPHESGPPAGFSGRTAPQSLGKTLGATWVAANVVASKGELPGVTLSAHYESSAAHAL